MKNNIKYTFILFVGIVLLNSCSDSFLDQYPKGKWHKENMPESDIKPDILAEGKLQEAFNCLKDWSNIWNVFAMHNYTTPEGAKGSTPSDGADLIPYEDTNMSYGPESGVVGGFYGICYSTIYKVHEALMFVDQIKDESKAEKKNEFRAQAIFMRAFMYYRLTQAFGDVPYVDHIMNADEKTPKRMNKDEIRAKYIQQLREVMPYLPTRLEKNASGNPGRATQNAARAIIAKTYLYQQDWLNAKNACLEIIQSGDNDLSTPFNEIFDESSEFGPESIFEVNCEQKPVEKIYMGCNFAQIQGFRGNPDYGWGFNCPSYAFADEFERENDPRAEATIMKSGDVLEGVTLHAAGDAHQIFNKKAYVKRSEVAKWGRSDQDFGNWKNIRLIRYSDIVLMYAEACCELGGEENITEALAKLEMVRKRARGGNSQLLPKVTTRNQEELRQAIRKERKFELAMEFERFYDLVRWGIAKDVISAFVTNKHELFPIPQGEIDKSEGILTQNPGYN